MLFDSRLALFKGKKAKQSRAGRMGDQEETDPGEMVPFVPVPAVPEPALSAAPLLPEPPPKKRRRW